MRRKSLDNGGGTWETVSNTEGKDMKICIAGILTIWSCSISSGNLTCVDISKVAPTVNENTALYEANTKTLHAKYFGSVACIAPDYVLEVLEKPSKAEKFVLEHDCVQRTAEPVVLYQEKGQYVSLIMFPKTGTQMYVPTKSIK